MPIRGRSMSQTQAQNQWIPSPPMTNAQLITLNQPQQQQQFQQSFISQQSQYGSANLNNIINKPPNNLRTRPISAGSSSAASRFVTANKINTVNTTSINAWSKASINGNCIGFGIPAMAGGEATLASDFDQTEQQQIAGGVDSSTYRQESSDYGVRITNLERELKTKSFEIRDLKEKLSFYQTQQNMGTGISGEVDQIKRDKSIAVGLVNTMQKDLTNKV